MHLLQVRKFGKKTLINRKSIDDYLEAHPYTGGPHHTPLHELRPRQQKKFSPLPDAAPSVPAEKKRRST